MLGKELGCGLTFDETGGGEVDPMGEWPENSGPHWVKPTIPVSNAFVAANSTSRYSIAAKARKF
jgi:hypothetical protein